MKIVGNNIGVRILILVILLGALLGFCVVSGSYLNQCPNPNCIAADYDGYVGESVRLPGTIVDTDPPVLEVSTREGRFTVELRQTDRSFKKGSRVRVTGRLTTDRAMVVTDSIEHRSERLIYMYAISLGGLIVLSGVLLQTWTIDREQLVFTPREGN